MNEEKTIITTRRFELWWRKVQAWFIMTFATKQDLERINIDTTDLAKDATSQEILEVVSGIKGDNPEATNSKILDEVQNKLTPLEAVLTELNNGKKEMVEALALKNVHSSTDKTLSAIAKDIRSIAQSSITIEGGEMYKEQVYGNNLYDIPQIATRICSDGRFAIYGGCAILTYSKLLASIDFTYIPANAYYTSDGVYYTELTTHTWKDNDEFFDRYIVVFYNDANFTLNINKQGYCPEELFIVKGIASVDILYNTLYGFSVIDVYNAKISTLKLSNSNTTLPYKRLQVINNYQEHTTGNYFDVLNSCMQYVEFKDLKKISGGSLFNVNSNCFNYIPAISFPELTEIENGALMKINGGGSSTSFSKLSMVYLPKLTSIKNGSLFGYSSANGSNGMLTKVRELILPSLRVVDNSKLFALYKSFTTCAFTGLTLLSLPAIEYFKGGSNFISTSLKELFIGYSENDKSLSISIQFDYTDRIEKIELKDGFCKPLNISSASTILTEDNIVNYILKRLKQDEEMCGEGVTITLGATNLAKLTSDESVALLDSLTNIYGYTFA